MAADRLAIAGEEVLLIQLARTAAFRTNIGFASLTASEITMVVDLHNADGGFLGSQTVSVAALGHRQLDDVFQDFGEVVDGYAAIRCDDAGARYAVYASVVDNLTGDPMYVAPVSLSSDELWVPVVAHTDGIGGTRWRSDLELFNASFSSAEVRIELLPRDIDNSGARETRTVSIGGRTAVRYVDVVGDLFGTEAVAALRIVPLSGELAAASRTYNVTATGTYGQGIPAVTADDFVLEGQETRLVGLRQTANVLPASRTNFGFLNPTPEILTVNLELVHGDGTPIGSETVLVPPYSLTHLAGVVQRLTEREVTNAFAVLTSTTPGASFFAYASIVDEQSGDPVYVPVQRITR